MQQSINHVHISCDILSRWSGTAVWFYERGKLLLLLVVKCYFFFSLAPGRCGGDLKNVILELILQIDILSNSCEITLKWMVLDLTDNQVNIGSGNGLVPDGTKPLPEPMFTQIYVAIYLH